MPFCYQTVCYIQFSSVTQSWPCQKPESGNEELRGWERKAEGGRSCQHCLVIQKGAEATDASFRPGFLLIKESLPEGRRQFAKFSLGNTEEIKESCLI